MSFILKMAWRDSRRSRRRLLLSASSIVMGVAALVAIGSFAANLRSAIAGQSKALLGADLAVESRQPFSPELEKTMQELAGESGQSRETALASMVVFPGKNGATRLVSVRAVEGGFPFYGVFRTQPEEAATALKNTDPDGAIVEETLLVQYGAQVGDPVKLGTKTFRILGALKEIPGDSAAATMLSPRVYIARAALAETGLVGPGSLVRYRAYFQLPPARDPDMLVDAWRERFRSERLGFDTVASRQRELGRAIGNVYGFLSLVGFTALLLGAIGVASAVQVYVRQKLPTVALLRCLGVSAGRAFAIYLVQGSALGLVGSLAGAALGIGVQLALPAMVKDFLPMPVEFFVSWPAVGRGVLAGLVVGVLFTLPPLLAVRRVSPLAAIRAAGFETTSSWRDPWRVLLALVIGAGVALLAVWQTASWRNGLGYAAGLVVSFLILTALARGVVWLARRLNLRGLPYVWRQGVANLHRPNNRTTLLLVSLGLGVFLLLTLSLTRETLVAQIRGTGGGDRPNLLFFDVQDDQIEPLRAQLAELGAPLKADAPIVTMRIRTLKGRAVEQVSRERGSEIPAWTLRREYRSTFRRELSDTEKVTAGKFIGEVKLDEVGRVILNAPVGREQAGEVAPDQTRRIKDNPPYLSDSQAIPISMEADLAEKLQLTLGDEIEWDVQGVPMRTRVTSLREVEWRRMQPNFFVVFPVGVLESAPKFYVAAARAVDTEASAQIQQSVVARFPNVSAIDLGLVLKTLDGIFSKVEFVVRFMALFTVATGLIVLVGAVMAGRRQRLRESVLLRTLGATRGQLRSIQLVEYAVLGALAGLTGGALAFGANALLARFVFEAAVVAPVAYLLAAVGGVSAVTLVTGLLSDRGVADQPPLEILRAGE